MDDWSFRYARKSDADYDQLRRKAVWNGCVPDRFPEFITWPENEQQVQQIVRFAKAQGLQVSVKSGGHSWSAAFLRDGAILIDLVNMKHFTFDIQARTAEVQPGAYASTLNDTLLDHELMFPGGHCPTVGMGGYLLQGGFGWNSRKWGLACESMMGMKLVTADGNIIYSDQNQNSEYYWAARGVGPAFFGVITSFTLRLHCLPPGIMTARYIFEVADLDQVMNAIDGISDEISSDLEICMFAAQDQDGVTGRPTIAITIDAFSDTMLEARDAVQFVHNLPVFRRCIKSYEFIECTLRQMMQRLDDILDNRGLHYHVDNIWCDAPVQQVLPSFHAVIDGLPPPPAHLYMTWWRPRQRPDMAFSLEARLYIAMYIISTDPTKDAEHAEYVRKSMLRLTDFEKGVQLADENLPVHPGRFMAVENYAKLETLRKKHDPENRFVGYMRLPEQFQDIAASLHSGSRL